MEVSGVFFFGWFLLNFLDMLRRFPDQAQDVIPRLGQSLDVVEDTSAIAAIITMIGEYGEIIEDGPYVLEEVIKDWDTQHPQVKAQLLVGTLKLFFKVHKKSVLFYKFNRFF